GVTASVVQIGFLNSEEALKLNFERLDPVAGFKRIFSLRAVVEGLKAIAKVSLIGVIVWFVIQSEIRELPQLVNYDVSALFGYMGKLALKLFGWIGIFMLGMAAFDYFFQRWELEKKMRMTKQEVKEEIKSREGDPL